MPDLTNPPVPATPLDVEACARLLTHFAAQEEARAEFMDEQARKILRMNTAYSVDRERENATEYRAQAAQLRVLASALPGMGKKADWYDWLADEDHVDWTRRLGNGNFAIETPPFGAKPDIERATLGECIDAARAAQPQETSADG